jgi:hypothetical protein
VRPCALEEMPSAWRRVGIVTFFVTVVLFGFLVEIRTAFLSRRMGDLNCYLRPAWAVRTGADIYQILDDCGWHYNYPPMLAVLLTPLADAPAGADRAGMLPYSVSAAIWYLTNVICLALGVHWLAGALESSGYIWQRNPRSGVPPRGSRRWWALRLVPVLACIVPVGHSLMRGQVTPIIVMCFCAALAALLRSRSAHAGAWLAWPICIKVFPAFLLIFPVAQRNGRLLTGCAVCALLGLVLVPVAAFGTQRTRDYYFEYLQVTLAPGLGLGDDTSRSQELTHVTSTDSQSLVAVMHNTLYRDRDTRPADANQPLRLLSYALGGLMTAVTLWAGGRRVEGADLLLYFGALILVMLLLCPVCHLTYFCMAIPLVMGLLAAAWEQKAFPRLSTGLIAVFIGNVVANALPSLPSLVIFRELGAATYMALILWSLAVVQLVRRSRFTRLPIEDRAERPLFAA